MASFTKRGKTWQYTVSAKPKPIRKGGFRTKKEAQIAAAEVEAALRKGIVPSLKSEPFDEYFLTWVKTYKTNIGNNTLSRYYNTYETIKEHFGGEPIQKINKRSYQSFLNEYGKDHAKETTKKLNSHIRACVRDAIDEGVLTIDFTRGAVITGTAGKNKDDKYLDYNVSKDLLKLVLDRLDRSLSYYLILLALTSGMRFSEMVGLTREDFDFTNNTINVNKTWGHNSKMHKGWGPTKTGGIRTIKMDKLTMLEFKKLFMKTPDNIKKLVFYSPSSKYHCLSNNAVNKILKKLLKELNTEYLTLHGMRHTHASVLLYEGVSVYYVSKRLGHENIQTTLNTYSHVIKELEARDENKSADIFEAMLV